jgi:hypothetical protein
MRAWHFVGDKLRYGRPVPADGVVLRHDGPLEMCESGLHFSKHPFDALQYAPGATLCLVECGGTIVEGAGNHKDKGICSERTIIARMDATDLLRYFARMQALSVIHLWDAPQIVCDYLMTGDESIRNAARTAASAWSSASKSAAASAAARALTAAWDAAWDAARDAAWAAASAAAWDAAQYAPRGDAMQTLVAASDAAWAAARDDFAALVNECFEDH